MSFTRKSNKKSWVWVALAAVVAGAVFYMYKKKVLLFKPKVVTTVTPSV